MGKNNKFRFRIELILIGSLSIFFTNLGIAQQAPCIYNIDSSQPQSINIRPEILIGLKSSTISPSQFSTTKGILLRCQFSLHNQKLFAYVDQHDYSFCRGSHIYSSGTGISPFWTDSLIQFSRTVKKGDSLIVKNIRGVIKNQDTLIELNSLPGIKIEDLRLVFAEPAYVPTLQELLFNKDLHKLKGYEKLSDMYASGYRIDVSMEMVHMTCDTVRQTCTKRIQYKTNHHLDFDFTFRQNNNGVINEIYDNLHKKKYTARKWEEMIKKVGK